MSSTSAREVVHHVLARFFAFAASCTKLVVVLIRSDPWDMLRTGH